MLPPGPSAAASNPRSGTTGMIPSRAVNRRLLRTTYPRRLSRLPSLTRTMASPIGCSEVAPKPTSVENQISISGGGSTTSVATIFTVIRASATFPLSPATFRTGATSVPATRSGIGTGRFPSGAINCRSKAICPVSVFHEPTDRTCGSWIMCSGSFTPGTSGVKSGAIRSAPSTDRPTIPASAITGTSASPRNRRTVPVRGERPPPAKSDSSTWLCRGSSTKLAWRGGGGGGGGGGCGRAWIRITTSLQYIPCIEITM